MEKDKKKKNDKNNSQTEQTKKNRDKDVWVFVEIKDHDRVLEGALELLTKGRELADKLNEQLVAVVLAQNCEQYFTDIMDYGPDIILYSSHNQLRHYHDQIFPEMIYNLIIQYKPSIFLFSSTEVGRDLASRLAVKCDTGLTAHCSKLEIIDHPIYGEKLLSMKRPAFSGNIAAEILCPYKRPQMATVQRGVFNKNKINIKKEIKKIKVPCDFDKKKIRIINAEAPLRWYRQLIPLEEATVVIGGGRGLGTKDNFEKLFELADLLNAEVGSTRVPVFNEWCEEERMIGQTGKTIKPDLYLNFGISGQIQHIGSVFDAKRIISVNIDSDAPIYEFSDYFIKEDAKIFLPRLIKRIKEEIKKRN